MATHDSLKSLVRQYIKTNGRNEITGQILQDVLIAMIDDLGITIDTQPTKDSTHAVSSGGTFGALQALNEINATLSGDGKICNNYQAGDIYYTEQNSVRIYWVALADGEASEENPVTISDLNFYHAENAVDAVRKSLSTKAFNIDAYTKQESDAKYQPKGNYQPAGDYATEQQLAGKANASDVYTKQESDTKYQPKGNYQPAGDYATEQQLAGKANASDVYTKSETYNKTELNNMITTPNQGYVSVTATAQTTAVTDLLPATGAADTIYRVGNWDGTQYNDSVFSEYAWNGSAYIKLCTKSQVGEVYDISANHADTKYADLAAALGTNGANVPQSLRRGGMSVKFVQSSDNKYVQARCMAQNFTTDTTQWAIAEEGIYVENPEFVYVKTDAEGKILWAIKADGGIYYGAGVPQQVVDYINERIAELSFDEYEDIVAFLNNLEKGDKTLQTLFDEKVDKENGKSLIDAEYAEGVSYVENPEWVDVKTDNEDKVLYGVKTDGKFYFGDGCPPQVKDYISTYGYNKDAVNALLASKVDKETGKSLINSDYASSQNVSKDTKFLEVTADSEGKILHARKFNGSAIEYCDVEYPNGIPNSIKNYVDDSIPDIQNLEENVETLDNKVSALENIIGEQTLQDSLAPVPVILDTDFGGDVDDAIALRILSYYETIGAIRIACVAGTRGNSESRKISQGISAVFDYDGILNVPVITKNNPVYDTDDGYCGEAATYPHTLQTSSAYGTSAYRKALASLNRKGVLIADGPILSLSSLIDSVADEVSPLNGEELIAAKISKVYIMGGAFPNSIEVHPGGDAEANWRGPVCGAAASNFISKCPVPIVFCGWEIGNTIYVGGECYLNLPTNDIIIHLMNWWYHTYFPSGSEQNNIIHTGRNAFDPVTVAVGCVGEPEKLGFELIRGTCSVNPTTGVNTFTESINGNHYYIRMKYDADYYQILLNNIISKRIWGCNNTAVLDRVIY